MSAFVPVACQHCGKRKIGELVAGMSRFWCGVCHRRTTAGLTLDGELHYVSVDKPSTFANNQSNLNTRVTSRRLDQGPRDSTER